MPRPEQPPTPASSTEIKGKDGSQFRSLQMSFELPPPAVAGTESQPSSATSKSSSGSSYHPTSPKSPAIPASETVKIRRRSSAAQVPPKDSFALPPPPTRSRKIIQMKPRQAAEIEPPKDVSKDTAAKSTSTTPPKKKQPSSTSVAGRKIARKTAHSLIERRRRSKMNEEFGVLKDMIPACTGEMHKLAILQASIDYVRYLEDCVSKLKAENSRTTSTPPSEKFVHPPPSNRESHNTPRHTQYEEDGDVEMGGSESGPSPTYTPAAHSNRPSASPALMPQDSRNRQNSYSSISTDHHRHYSFSASATTSPALGPSAYNYAHSTASIGSTLTSPVLAPQRDLDQEATAALLMLNTDRRGTHGSISGRGGMSVKDLLSA
ncbi:Sterol regulatory element-binding protein [Lachnellula suecica]|uniref:Sterol regulatory element-binding protein n=1 Tax=Lachnellula suecica TaxID=602035 RepID=A0A8T9BVZ6_9HELO|nr:Sterol regulatory element-binding protein [Lachnellula suecica]